MFRKIRIRTVLYQIALIFIVLIAVFAFNGIYNYEIMINQIDSRLNESLKYGRDFSDNKNQQATRPEFMRNLLVIKVYSDKKYESLNLSYYDEEMIKKIISIATDGDGRKIINGKNIAYVVTEEKDMEYYCIFAYDYTNEYNLFINNLLTILCTCLAVMVMGSILVFKITKRDFTSIENAFYKQQELVANASHELKTPLTIINTDLSILNLSSDSFTDEQKKWLNGIGTQISRMSAMINEMLELARFEAIREKNTEIVNFSEIAESVVLETEALAFEKQVEFVSDIAPKVKISARKAEIEKLVFILVENAMKYTEPKGKITVKLNAERHRAYLRVRNTGAGIPREKLPKLFDRFYRLEESHTTAGSFGLGLSIAKAITDSNNGTIGVDSKVGQYTEFIVIFKEE